MSASFSFTNTTASTKCKPVGIALGLKTNYALIKEQPEEVRISNTTASLDQPEIISYRFNNMKQVNSLALVKYPAANPSAVKYNIRVDAIYRETTASGEMIDHPIAMSLTVDHELTSVIDETVIDTVLTRLLGACYDETAESFRFMDLARSSLQPTEN